MPVPGRRPMSPRSTGASRQAHRRRSTWSQCEAVTWSRRAAASETTLYRSNQSYMTSMPSGSCLSSGERHRGQREGTAAVNDPPQSHLGGAAVSPSVPSGRTPTTTPEPHCSQLPVTSWAWRMTESLALPASPAPVLTLVLPWSDGDPSVNRLCQFQTWPTSRWGPTAFGGGGLPLLVEEISNLVAHTQCCRRPA
jgi:hypothetical protein